MAGFLLSGFRRGGGGNHRSETLARPSDSRAATERGGLLHDLVSLARAQGPWSRADAGRALWPEDPAGHAGSVAVFLPRHSHRFCYPHAPPSTEGMSKTEKLLREL